MAYRQSTLNQPSARAGNDPLSRRALEAERRRQVRGLLVIAAAVVVLLVHRAAVQGVFHAGWWRF